VTVGRELSQGKKNVQSSHDIVHLREDRMLAINHRVGSGALFGKMHHCVGLELTKG
jgi:hypothetical protein